MALFLKQTEQRSQLQERIAAELTERAKVLGAGKDKEVNTAMPDDQQQAATGRSLFWVGVITMVVIAGVVFVLFIFNGI